MTFDPDTIAAVYKRLADGAYSRPALFNDRMPHARLMARYARVSRWLGILGRAVMQDVVYRGYRFDDPGRRYGRNWTRKN